VEEVCSDPGSSLSKGIMRQEAPGAGAEASKVPSEEGGKVPSKEGGEVWEDSCEGTEDRGA